MAKGSKGGGKAAKPAPRAKAASKAKPAAKQTSSTVSSLASNVLAGRVKPTLAQIKKLAASALGQDQTKGQKKNTK
jgi:hypothetical protein